MRGFRTQTQSQRVSGERKAPPYKELWQEPNVTMGMAKLAEMPFVRIIFPFSILNSSYKRSEVHRHKSFYTLEGQRQYTGTR